MSFLDVQEHTVGYCREASNGKTAWFRYGGKTVNVRYPIFIAWNEYMMMSITAPWWVMCLWGRVHKLDTFSHCMGLGSPCLFLLLQLGEGAAPSLLSVTDSTPSCHICHIFPIFFFLPGTHSSDSGLSRGFKMINLSHSFLFSFVLSSGRINHMPSCFTWKSTVVFSDHCSFSGTPWIQTETFTWLNCQKQLNSSETFLFKSPWNPAYFFSSFA